MDQYFDATKDAGYLDPAIRSDSHIAFLVSEAKALLERHVTSFDYHCDAFKVTETGLPDRYICLRGYNPDPALAPASLVDRVKRCLAHMIRWRSQSRGLNPHVQSDGGQNAGKSYKLDSVRETIPVEALRHLKGYLIENEVYVL